MEGNVQGFVLEGGSFLLFTTGAEVNREGDRSLCAEAYPGW